MGRFTTFVSERLAGAAGAAFGRGSEFGIDNGPGLITVTGGGARGTSGIPSPLARAPDPAPTPAFALGLSSASNASLPILGGALTTSTCIVPMGRSIPPVYFSALTLSSPVSQDCRLPLATFATMLIKLSEVEVVPAGGKCVCDCIWDRPRGGVLGCFSALEVFLTEEGPIFSFSTGTKVGAVEDPRSMLNDLLCFGFWLSGGVEPPFGTPPTDALLPTPMP